MSASRVQVLTLAELAFTIVFALIILSIPQVAQGRRVLEQVSALQQERDRLKVALKAAEDALADAKKRLNELESSKSGKLSNIPPPCQAEPLEDVVVAGANDFLVSGDSLTAEAIVQRHQSQVTEAEQNKCRHRVIVRWQESLGATALDSALRRMERYFYIQRSGSVAAR